MEKIDSRRLLVPLIFLALAVALMINCGGGGGGGSSAVAVSGTGTVAVYLTDSPADDYEHIWIWITEISLIPENGGEPVVIFHDSSGTPAGVQVDLLALRDEESLFKIRKDVPAGTYSKIRLGVSNIEVEAKEGRTPACSEVDLIKLPSGKIDLNPRAPFRVAPGGVLSITLDVDACKSINLHPTGSGKCIFRPVVFVDIAEGFKTGCPQVLGNTIVALYISTDPVEVTGFSLLVNGTYVDVRFLEGTRIFDTAGVFTNPSDLQALDEGQKVRARGNFNTSGVFETSFVIVGDVLKVSGIVDGAVSSGQFSMTAFTGEAIVGQKTVKIFDEKTLILLDCNHEAPVTMIQPGMRVRVFAKEVANTLNAAVILLDVTGTITALQNATGGQNATIQEEIQGVAKPPVTVFIPTGTPVDIDGQISTDWSFICIGRYVRVAHEPYENGQPLTAKKIFVPLEQDAGVVLGIDPDSRTLFIRSNEGTPTVVVPDDAAIYDITTGSQVPADFGDIEVNDTVAFTGLESCEGGFEARVVLIFK
jgi:Domain of unknown function (DUF4382)